MKLVGTAAAVADQDTARAVDTAVEVFAEVAFVDSEGTVVGAA